MLMKMIESRNGCRKKFEITVNWGAAVLRPYKV